MLSLPPKIALITGANSGIGFELARQLLQNGTYHVLLGSRTMSKGTAAVSNLQERNLPGTIELLQLDVRNDEHISEAARRIAAQHGRLDVLVNNAAVALPEGATERERLSAAFDTNATGPWLLAKALMPLLWKGGEARIINISSGAGSIGRRLFAESPMYKIQAVPYRASKVALNMMSACMHVEFGLVVGQVDGWKADAEEDGGDEKKGVKVFCYDPGFTVSNLGPHNKADFGARSAEETVRSIMEIVDGKRDEEAGRFIHNSGEYPW
ncbi:NAD(P)-binding protein [Decorospora gaudefroyi]|uniref:NAD(P)-binding protein n=1 Tax=Decorospora gaudefroyi TaxID=184978 RepID=A0A6A5KE88_9PLEO|nr:NAD(P)-binding protein [Decorospora gaudefroyi]